MSAKASLEYYLGHWSDIQGHLSRLYEVAKGNCLEIGVRSGISTSALLSGIEDHGGHLYSVDVNDCEPFRGHPDWTFIHANSIKDAEVIKGLIPGKLDLLFVDGDHTYEGALSDLRNFGPLAKQIFVHDTEAPDYPGVRRAVIDYCKESGRVGRFMSGSYGIGIIE